MRAALVACITCIPTLALAQGRILTERSREPPALDPEQAVLYIKRMNAVVGDCDPPTDAGVDAPLDADLDAAAAADAAATADADADADADAGTAVDAGTCTTIPGPAITMVVQPTFTTGPDGTRFAIFLATPAPPLYATASPSLFDTLAAVTAPREQHVRVEQEDPAMGTRCAGCVSAQSDTQGCGGGYGSPEWNPPDVPDAGFGDGGVDVIPVGDYEVLRLTVTDATTLAAWLDQFNYEYTQADLDAITPYIVRGDTITAVRVSLDSPVDTDSALPPLSLTWPGTDVRIPLALVRPPPDTTESLTVYIAAETKYRLPDSRIAFAGYTLTDIDSPPYLSRNDLVVGPDRTLDRDPLAEIFYGPDYIPVTTIEDIVRVPVTVSCDDDYGCCPACNSRGRHRVRWDAVFVAVGVLVVLRRRRPRRMI